MTAALPLSITHCLERLARAVKPRDRLTVSQWAEGELISLHRLMKERDKEIERLRQRVKELEGEVERLTPIALGYTQLATLKAEQGEPVRCNPSDYCACQFQNLYTTAPTIPAGWKLVPVESNA